jgi:hypothetical protein
MKHNKIIIWGAKLDTGHTHGFIHESCYRAAKHMGWQTYWLDNRDNVDESFFDDAIVITEQWLTFQNGISNKMPINKNATYLVHYLGNRGPVEGNPGADMYLGKVRKLIDFRFNAKHGWGINGVEDKNYAYKFEPEKYEALSDVSFYERSPDYDRLYTIWATDLLPSEINLNHRFTEQKRQAFFCGTIREDNGPLFEGFIRKCKEHDIPFLYNTPWQNQMPTEQIREYVTGSLLPLDIRPQNHLANGYIACRPIKNASYGALPMTNSAAINEFFNGECAYAEDSADLFDIAMKMQQDPTTKDLILHQMERIKRDHTYINRMSDIITAAEI